jgi:hypothetical protein
VASKQQTESNSWATDDPRRAWFEKYSPVVVSYEAWVAVREFVFEQVERCDLAFDRTRLIVKVLAQLAAWCLDEHIGLDVENVLDPDTADRWVESPLWTWSPRTRASYRSALREIGPALTKTAPWQPRPKPYARVQLPRPYDDFELRVILRDIRGQRTPFRSRAARAVVALGLGAGLDARWSCKIRGNDVGDDRTGVFVSVMSPAARVVYVRREFAWDILELADDAGDGLLVGSNSTNKNLPNAIAKQTVIDQGRVALQPGRLRSTWIVAQLDAGTHLRVLMDAAGIETLDAIRDLMRYVAPVAPDLEAEMLVWA